MITKDREENAKKLIIVATVVGAIAGVFGAIYTAKSYWLADAQQRVAQTPTPPRPPSSTPPATAPTGGVTINGPVTQTTSAPNSPNIIGNGNQVGPSK